MKLPFDRFLNLVYFYATDDAEQAEKDKFDIRLNKPDVAAIKAGKAAARGPWSAQAETNSLNLFVAQTTGKVNVK